MEALRISVNGEHVCTAGVGSEGVVSAHIVWNRGSQRPADLRLSVSGLDTIRGQYPFWRTPEISLGDTITAMFIETDSIDQPEHVYTPSHGWFRQWFDYALQSVVLVVLALWCVMAHAQINARESIAILVIVAVTLLYVHRSYVRGALRRPHSNNTPPNSP